MASTRTLAKSINMSFLQNNNKIIYVSLRLERMMTILKRVGYKTAILSGGFTYFGNYLRQKYGFDYVYANELEIEQGKLTGRYVGEVVDGRRKAELLRMAENAEHVPGEPARDFWEACQSQWFTQMFSRIEQKTGTTISNGRMDQYFYPYYKQDRAAGKITEAQLEQVRRDFAKAFRVLKESRTLTATNTYQAYVRVPDSDQVIAVHAPNPWADDQEIRAVVATYDGDVILDEMDFPVKMTAYTPCFRREAGSYGKDVRGLNRLHQFDKVEIVQLSLPQNSYEALDGMVAHVESIVRSLGLPYRILRLCGGDMSFTSALTYDFEVYSEAQKRWLEVSSVSNFESFQANRLKLRYKDADKKTRLAHTLNGSSLALPRIVAALLENNQTPDGIRIPEALIPYTGFDMIK